MKDAGPPVRCAYTRLETVSKLKPNPANPNRHDGAQLGMYAKILRHQGWRKAITVSKRSGLIVTGHGAYLTAKAEGWAKVPVDVQDFASKADETAHLLADNKLPQLADLDLSEVGKLIASLDGLDLDLTGYSGADLDQALAGLNGDGEVDAEPQIDRAEELRKEWGTKLGQVWRLGDHRLMCGDSCLKDDVDELFGEKCARLLVTDPPYGVDYDPSWRIGHDLNIGKGLGLNGMPRSVGKVQNDNRKDWSECYRLFSGDVAYVWHAGVFAAEVSSNLSTAGFEIRAQIIWTKQHFVFGRGAYHWQHEPCWYAVKKGCKANWFGGRKQTTIWDIQNNNPIGHRGQDKEEKTGHGTQKPVECMARPIRNNSRKGDLVYDPFLGSGTTLIACEQLGRKCRAMEISPGYVAVALQRFKDATGKTPVLL